MDSGKLTSAPWKIVVVSEEPLPAFLIGGHGLLWGRVVGSPDRDAATDAEFIVSARGAFDVMMRRGWVVAPCNGKWDVMMKLVPGGGADGNWGSLYSRVSGITTRLYNDPFTALVAADRWYRENVEDR